MVVTLTLGIVSFPPKRLWFARARETIAEIVKGGPQKSCDNSDIRMGLELFLIPKLEVLLTTYGNCP